jgi:glycine/D-amino acid oxidase-like deaminating enzyme
MPLPQDNPTSPYWLSHDSDLSKHRTTEELPQEADVVIIGSGYSGATAAYYLLEKDDGKRPSVVILEARDTCSGATGRNGGHLKPDVYFGAALNEKTFGAKVAEELTRFEIEQVIGVKKLVEKENIDCEFELTRAIDVFLDHRVLDTVVASIAGLKARGYQFSDDLHFIEDPKKAEQVSGVKGALAAFTFTAGTVWPYKLILHLLRRCLEWGANLQTNTPVLKLSGASDGRWVLETPRGQITAKKVIVATNAYTMLPELADKITPARGVACRIAVPESGKLAPHLNNSYSIRYAPGEYDYIISRTDGSIVVGGAKQVVLLKDEYWHNNADDSELIPGAEKYFENYMQRMFHGWEDSGARVTDIWTGVMGYSADLMPWVGEMPGKPGIFVTAGFTGHGMPRVLGCSGAIAALVREDIPSLKETKVPQPYWITEGRLQVQKSVVREYMTTSRTQI